MLSQGGRGGGQKLPILLSKKTTKRGEGVKNCWSWDDIVYGRPLMYIFLMRLQQHVVFKYISCTYCWHGWDDNACLGFRNTRIGAWPNFLNLKTAVILSSIIHHWQNVLNKRATFLFGTHKLIILLPILSLILGRLKPSQKKTAVKKDTTFGATRKNFSDSYFVTDLIGSFWTWLKILLYKINSQLNLKMKNPSKLKLIHFNFFIFLQKAKHN